MVRIKKWIVAILFFASCLSLPALAKRLTHGFKLAKIHLDSPPYFDDQETPSTEIRQILSQNFSYLSRGAQCYAFLSKDRQYVLKLFRFDQKTSPIGSRPRLKQKRRKVPSEEKVDKFFNSCRLAAKKASDETGLLFLHLNQTEFSLPVVHAKGPLGRSFRIPLDHCRFALQKKAEPLLDVLLASGEELWNRIEEIIDLLERRILKQIGNTDSNLWRNFAFLEDRAIEIDFGNYIFRPDFVNRENAQRELERYMKPLRSWLQENAPELVLAFNARLENSP